MEVQQSLRLKNIHWTAGQNILHVMTTLGVFPTLLPPQSEPLLVVVIVHSEKQ